MTLDPQGCAYQEHPELNEPPTPAEYCENDALDGSDHCEVHSGLDDGPDPDAVRDRLIDDEMGVL